MVSGCSGIINDRVYTVTPSNNYYTLDSTLLNGTTLANATGCPPVTSFSYSACTVINDPPTIVMVGTDSHGTAGSRLLQFSSTGSCQLSEKWYSITGMGQPVSVVPASCASQTSTPCFAVLGLSSINRQYIIQYPTSLSFSSSNPLTVGLGDSGIHPVLARPPNDMSKMYVIGYPTKDQILVLNGNTSTTTSPPMPTVLSTGTTLAPTLTVVTAQPIGKNSVILRRAEPTTTAIVDDDAGSYIKLGAPIENTGPATTVGNNIVVVSSTSLSVEIIPASSSSGTLPITKLDIPPSSQIQNANSLKGIDSLTVQNGDASTVWINYDDGTGNHVQTSSQQPGLFTTPTNPDSGTPTDPSQSVNNGMSSLSTGAIVGIVIGCIAAGALLGLLCFYLSRRKRRSNRQHQDITSSSNNRNISFTDQRCLTEKTASTPTTYVSTPNKDDATSTILLPVSHDDIDDVPPLASLTRQVNNHSDAYYEPTSSNDTLLLESSVYHLHNEPPSYAVFPQGYATRSATRTPNGQPSAECTIHYFPASSAHWIRHLLHTNAGLQAAPDTGLHTYDAITLSSPTHQGYQYIWITSPFQLQHTLQSLLFEGSNAVVDCQQFSFKAWSSLSMLKSLEAFHGAGWVHRKLNPTCFFYDQASSVTDWRLLGFYQSIWYTGLADKAMDLAWDDYSAPECVQGSRVSMPSMDIWSMGCVLYSLATGKRVFQHMDDYQAVLRSGQLQAKVNAMLDDAAAVDDSYKHLLQRMLQINPAARDSLANIITYWVQTNQLDDDE